ncbi:hypothetical protein E2562_014327 [Oryza meyeriana var. granulata]|uniref:Uncharacterized protein n=1 Tax=Oryza meyeriana var. granulata TaxID=110450 RepID=A0A6G1C6B5_9ORYZ|nr:hypothetical protein E2562_014327 [Oryza meyeriana var. granulata]
MRSSTTAALLLLAVAATLSPTAHAAASTSLPRRLAAGGNVTAGCSPRERDALLAFKRGITADPAGLLA